MAGWFEAFAQFANSGAQGLNRYQQLRQLAEDNAIRRKTQELAEKKLLDDQETTSRQRELLDLAVLDKKREAFVENTPIGSEISDVKYGEGVNLGLEDILHRGTGAANPMELGPAIGQNPLSSGQQYTLGKTPGLGMMPLTPGQTPKGQPLSTYQMPETPFDMNKYLGTQTQRDNSQLNQLKIMGLQLPFQDRAQVDQMVQDPNFDPTNPRHMAMLTSRGGPNLNQIMDITQPAQQGGQLGWLMNLPPQLRDQAIGVYRQMNPDTATPRDPYLSQLTQMQIAKLQGDMQQNQQFKGLPAEVQHGISRAIMNLPDYKQGSQKQVAMDSFMRGNMQEFVKTLRQSAIESELAGDKAKIMARIEGYAQLDEISKLLKEAKAVGVNTNLVAGSWQNLMRLLGTGDPVLTNIGARIDEARNRYRQALSGAAFSQSEDESYKRQYPSYKNDPPLNDALINGLRGAFRTSDTAYWNFKLPSWGRELIQEGVASVRTPKGDVVMVPTDKLYEAIQAGGQLVSQ